MTREPIFNVPTAVAAVLVLMAAIHGGLALLPDELDEQMIWTLAFVPARYTGMAGEIPGGPLAAWTSFVTHQLVHGNMMHLLINGAWLLVFGSAVARRIGDVRFLVFSLVCGFVGALTFMVAQWGEVVPMVGASGAISGLMAAGFRLLLPAIDNGEIHAMHDSPRSIRLATLSECMRSRRVVLAVAAFVVLNFGFAVAGPMLSDAAGIAWEAHLGGFAAGFLLLGAFDATAPAELEPPRP